MDIDLLIKNGTVVDPVNNLHRVADVAVSEGKIAEIADDVSTFRAASTIDATGKLVVPGVIDPHTHTVRPGSRGVAYRMLLRCGVTTTMDMRGPIDVFLEEMRTAGSGINAGCMNALFAEKDMPTDGASGEQIRACIEERLRKGAFGIKIMGGHYPFSPDVTGRIIETCAERRSYVAFHCGTTATGSNIKGLLEAVELAGDKPLHVAHINSYCRGMVYDVHEELKLALDALRAHPNLVSESYLSVMNGTYCTLDAQGAIESRVTRNCLRMGGYPETAAGLEQAILNGYCVIYALAGGEMALLSPAEGHAYWKSFPGAQCTFAVNNPVSLLSCAVARRKDGSFVVDGFCSDGGANPRNVIFRNGLALVRAKYMTLEDLVRKASVNPARMLGLSGKGHLTPGADGDLAIFDPQSGDALYTIVNGTVCMAGGVCRTAPGTVLTGPEGAEAVRKAGLEARTPDLAASLFLNGHAA